jgi:hypothetical protein
VARAKKIKFVVGMFDAVADLRRALEALSGVGLSCDRLCVLARETPEVDDRQPTRLPDIAADGLSQVVVAPLDAQAPPRFVPPSTKLCGRVACDPRCAIDPELVVEFPHWIVGRQARQLEDQLMLGGTLLFVRVNDDGEQMRVGRTLLRHARNGVQTHDLVA